MRPHYLPILIALIQLAFPSITIPTTPPSPSPLHPRTQYCANAPPRLAGTRLPRRHPPRLSLPPPPVSPRGNPALITWCTSTRIRIVVRLTTLLPAASDSIHTLLTNVIAEATTVLGDGRDGPLSGGDYLSPFRIGRPFLLVQNANNHQTTWGVLEAAVAALLEFMQEVGFGKVEFSVFDGGNEVGVGVVGVAGEVGGVYRRRGEEGGGGAEGGGG